MAAIIIQENEKERTFKIQDDVISIGREISCSVQIQDDASSRKHCRIEKDGLRFVVEDLQSRNGTYLNEIQLQGRKPLKDGDVIRIGKARIVFQDSARPVEHTVAVVTSPLFVRLAVLLTVGAVLGGIAWATISTLNSLTHQREDALAQPVNQPPAGKEKEKEKE